MPKCEPSDNLRKKYGIPKDAFVLGRYGGPTHLIWICTSSNSRNITRT